ncbi:hypothetical protein [Hyphomicrobium sp. NDB2Meth4]|uniref:hypothetical protein n=1 Tax=Hyphomicrobium sp. NDB2Meth4 TaxID=1892846 RepID=UPI001FCE197E|nr:hypothetical protein [Hyphomicrobium sp. NDB2Meth4]
MSKAIQSVYTAAEFGLNNKPTLELAAALGELLDSIVAGMRDGQLHLINYLKDVLTDGYTWCSFSGAPTQVDVRVLRALVTTIRSAQGADTLTVTFAAGGFLVSTSNWLSSKLNDSILALLRELSFWGNLEMTTEEAGVAFSVRRSDG